MKSGLPDLLTVEEAAGVLRIGRTKAYAMAQEWRTTGGKSGLPVVDFGHVLRVPRHQLEAIVGGPLGRDDDPTAANVVSNTPRTRTAPSHESPEPSTPRTTAQTAPLPSPRPPRKHRNRTTDQLDLFNAQNPPS